MVERTERLIDSLVADASPVRHLWPPAVRLVVWLALCASFAAALAIASGGALSSGARVRTLAPELVATLVAIVVCAALSLRAAVPGRSPRGGRLAVAVLIALTPMLFWHSAPGPVPFVARGIPCALRTLALALLPTLTILWAVYRGAPLAPRRAAMLGGGAGLLAAGAGVASAFAAAGWLMALASSPSSRM